MAPSDTATAYQFQVTHSGKELCLMSTPEYHSALPLQSLVPWVDIPGTCVCGAMPSSSDGPGPVSGT